MRIRKRKELATPHLNKNTEAALSDLSAFIQEAERAVRDEVSATRPVGAFTVNEYIEELAKLGRPCSYSTAHGRLQVLILSKKYATTKVYLPDSAGRMSATNVYYKVGKNK